MTDAHTISIRLARLDEKAFLDELQQRSSLANPGDREFLLANPDIGLIPPQQIEQGFVFVAESGDVVVGLVALQKYDAPDMELDGLFVEPALFRRGIGRRLVNHAVDFCRVRGARKIVLFANPHALEFYLAMNFEKTGYIEIDHNRAVVMVLKL